MGHGTVDPVISYGWGQDSFDILNETLGMAHLEWHGYEGEAGWVEGERRRGS